MFLAYWVTIRLSVGFSAYVFHHALHYRGGRYGTFRLQPPPLVDRVIRLVLGTESALIVYEHPAHHRWQQVKALHLPDLGIDAIPVGHELAPPRAEELEEMICEGCHHENPQGARFCNECGSPLKQRCAACQAENPAEGQVLQRVRPVPHRRRLAGRDGDGQDDHRGGRRGHAGGG